MSLRRYAASLFEPFSAWGFWGVCRLSLFEPLFKGRRKQGCKKTMARPEGAQALRAIQEALDEGRSLPVVNYIPLPARLCRLLPTGRKNDWRGAWGVVRSPFL